MQYMTFDSSCSYCAVANLLEFRDIHTTDAQLALAAHIPYRLRYEDGCFSTGAMLQRPEDFNRALAAYGLHFSEVFSGREAVAGLLIEHIPCMVGLRREQGRHAMVFTGIEGGWFRFRNPHREGDGQPDTVLLTEAELLGSLGEETAVGWLSAGAAPPQKGETGRSLAALSAYRDTLHSFLHTRQTKGYLLADRDRLLRPLAIDLPAAMALVGEDAFVKDLLCLREQILALFRREECTPGEWVSAALLEKCLAEWERQMQAHPL